MDKRKIVRYLLITLSVILGVLVFLSITGTVAHAAGLVDNTVSDANTYSKYPLENYQLDFYVDSSWDWLPWNWLDGIGKSIQYGLYAITNFVWTVSLYISNATGYVVQEAYKLDFISDTASSIGKNIQTLAGVTSSGFSSEGFYVGFLLILILVMGIYVAYTGLIKRETTKAVHAVINFLVVFLLSASFIAYAPNYISKINDFSADISSSALSLGTKIVLPDSNSKGKDSVDLIRDSLFSIQVKQPWLLLQYGESDIETLGSDRVESLLSASPDTDDREDIVIEEIENKDNDNLSVTKTMTRLGMEVFLFIFNIGISVFVFLLTGMMIFSQVLFIIYAMFLPISFILSMIPTYEGMSKKALGVYKNFTAIDMHTVHEKEVIEQRIVDTNRIENFVKAFAKSYYSWSNTQESIDKRTAAINNYLTKSLQDLNVDTVRQDIPTSSTVTDVKIWDIEQAGTDDFTVVYSVDQTVTEGETSIGYTSAYMVVVHVDSNGNMVITQNPTISSTPTKSSYEPKTKESDGTVDAATTEEVTEFLETFFKLYPTATEKELAYYVSGNVLEPVNCGYLFSELVNPIFIKDGEQVKVSVSVKYLDQRTKATQISQFDLVLKKTGGNWKVVG